MGLYTAASKKVTKKVRNPNGRRRRMVPHVGVVLPLAPDSCNCCLLSSSAAVGMVVVANVAVLLIRARGRRAVRRAAVSVMGRVLPAAAAGNGVDGCFIVRIDGGDGVAMGRGTRSRESWMPRGPRWSSCSLSSLDAILDANKGSFTKECGLEVDCNRVQERACAKAGSTLCRSTCEVLFENVHVG